MFFHEITLMFVHCWASLDFSYCYWALETISVRQGPIDDPFTRGENNSWKELGLNPGPLARITSPWIHKRKILAQPFQQSWWYKRLGIGQLSSWEDEQVAKVIGQCRHDLKLDEKKIVLGTNLQSGKTVAKNWNERTDFGNSRRVFWLETAQFPDSVILLYRMKIFDHYRLYQVNLNNFRLNPA